MRGDNVFEMLVAKEGLRELYLRRHSWGQRTVCRVIGTHPPIREWRDRKPPYFDREIAKNGECELLGSPRVFAVVHWSMNDGYEFHKVSCPGTYGYEEVERPHWWVDLPVERTRYGYGCARSAITPLVLRLSFEGLV